MSKTALLIKAVVFHENKLRELAPEWADIIIDMMDNKIALLQKEVTDAQKYMSLLNQKINDFDKKLSEPADVSLLRAELKHEFSKLRTELRSAEQLALTRRGVANLFNELKDQGTPDGRD